MSNSPKKVYTFSQALLKAANFCAYQERTQAEVRQKLYDYGYGGEEGEAVIARLIEENYINEERFARTYAGSKFRVKKWGRVKIERALRQKGLSEYCVRAGMSEIEEEDYLDTLRTLLEKKRALSKEANEFKLKQKIARYALGKGYESGQVWECIREIFA